MSVRCKMIVSEVTNYAGGSARVKLQCVHTKDGIPEDQQFTKYTPYGEATFNIDNPPAVAQFKVGAALYVDFTPVEPA